MLPARRIAIVGSPRAGKTTLAQELGRQLALPVVSSDDYIALGWSSASTELARRIAEAPGVFEGVAVVRALRKLLQSTEAKPVDRVVVLREPREPLTPGQERMRKGCESILAAIRPELERRDVSIAEERA